MPSYTAHEIKRLALFYAKDVDPALVAAICMIESAGDPWAVRNEPGYRWTLPDAARPSSCSKDTELEMQRTSWGLCQIMGANARALGWDGWLTELLVPHINLALGCRFMDQLAERYPEREDMISAYNAGSPRKRITGKYVNQPYVDKVLKMLTDTGR